MTKPTKITHGNQNEQRAGKGTEQIFQGGEEEGGVLTAVSVGRS